MSVRQKRKSSRRLLKKLLLNLFAILLALAFFVNVVANENAGQLNAFLGIPTTKTAYVGEGEPGPYPRYFESAYESIADLKAAGLAKVQEVEAEGAVLLKNDGATLPLQSKQVSLFGATAISPVYGGTGSGAVSAEAAPSYLEAMTAAGLEVVNTPVLDWYEQEEYGREFSHGDINEASWKRLLKSDVADSFGHGETAIFVIGRIGGEANDLRSVDHNDGRNGDYLRINKAEGRILKGLKGLKDEGKLASIVVLINSSNPISADFLQDEDFGVDAALWVGSVGETGLFAVADILAGKVNPSGSLPDTWWMDNLSNPAMANFGLYTYEGADAYDFGSSPRPFTSYVVYQEGMYLGYRYTETRYEDVVLGTPKVGDFVYEDTVAYPFGFGLSYTDFSVGDFHLSETGEGAEKQYLLEATVENIGKAPGKKTVQVYAQKPYTDYDREHGIEKAAVELVGYAKTDILAPGEKAQVQVEVPAYFLTSYDTFGTGHFILSEGTHYFATGANAHEALNHILAAKGKDVDDGMTAEGDASLVQSIDLDFDAETFAKSYGTGEAVKSRFATADINRYEGRGDNEVAYISRSDWEGTVQMFTPDDDGYNTNFIQLTMTEQMAKDLVLDDEDLPKDDGNWPVMGSDASSHQLIDLRVDADGQALPFDDPKWEELLDQLSYEQLSRLTAVGLRMTININEIGKPETLDHNGPSGVTQPYGVGSNGLARHRDDPDKDMFGTAYPSNGIMAATFNDKLVEEVGELIGEDAMWAGYAGFYGTGLNLHRTPYSGRVFEYYSEDSLLTALIATPEVRGIQSKGVYVYNKHFVLNDQEQQRQGLGTWVNEQALRELYLRAFEWPIIKADAKCVMTAFNRLGPIWAGAMPELLLDWLRGEAGMSGFAVTDMYDGIYMSKPHEVLAGNDIPDNYPGVTGTSSTAGADDGGLGREFAAYGPEGTQPIAQIARAMREASHRLLYTVVHSRGMDGLSPDIRLVSVVPWWSTTLQGLIYGFGALTALLAAWILWDMLRKRSTGHEAS